MSFADLGEGANEFEARAPGRVRRTAVALISEVESRFTGMIFLLYRVFSQGSDGRLKPLPGPDMGYAVRRPRRA